uniref:Tail protein n=1 Tax=viral metagenome TaxID=1070528 RepID=A0A6M3J9J6_9ZZZZ
MSTATYRSFVTAMIGLVPTGITVLSQPPATVLATMPIMWPMLPSGNTAPVTFQATEQSGLQAVDLYVAVESVAQNMPSANYDAVITAMDALETALRALNVTAPYALSWAMRGATISVAGTDYWGFICTVTRNSV